MSEQGDSNTEDTEDQQAQKRYVSERGPFEVWENPKIYPSYPPEIIDYDQAAAIFEYGALAEKAGEKPTSQKIGQMIQSYGHGTSTTPLFAQSGPNGMTLTHIWFGPNLPLFRHSHPGLGDCLYYVLGGEIILGRQRLGAGSGFFVPKEMPYKYTAGPAGVEALEFRAGGGTPGAPPLKLEEQSLDSMQRIIDIATKNQPNWSNPDKIGDTLFRQAEYDAQEDPT